MLKVDSSLNHIPAGPNHVIGLHESINQPLVNIPNFGTAPTAAYVLGTRNDQGAYTVFVYLHQAETRAVVVYVSEPRHLTHDQYRVEETEALRFVESMGFMVDNLHFPTLAPPEQEAIMSRVPLFRPPQATVDLYDIQEESAPPRPAIFGGLSPQDSAMLRQATSQPPAPAMAAPVMGKPAMPPRRAVVPGAPVGSSPPTGTVVPLSAIEGGASGSIVAAPAPPPPTKAEPDPQAIKRIGRILGTFAWLAIAVAGPACKSSGTEQRQTAGLNAQLDLGNQQLAQGQWPDAIKAFTKALSYDDDNFEALRGVGLAYMRLNRLEQAESYYRKALDANPKSSVSRNELAVVLMRQRRCEDAVPLIEQVLEDIFYPTPQFAEHNLALAIACLGRVDEAIDRLDKLVTKRPDFCLGYLTLSRLASEANQPDATIRACDDFAHYCEQNERIKDQVLPQQSALCYLRKGMAYAQLGDIESARASFERCRTIGDVGRSDCTKSLEMLPR